MHALTKDYCVYFTYSPKGKYAAMGLQDGRLRMYVTPKKGDLGALGPHWTAAFHDCEYGDVTGLAFSADGNYLFSIGLDGNFFKFAVTDQRRSELGQTVRAELPKAKVICLIRCRHVSY